ncbi:MAG TPA: FkbM family methyltransferase, partial [Acetobacteraceae bacterium]|nr:FkbM family methyltransferase [Acetobacteraceae bacterium]
YLFRVSDPGDIRDRVELVNAEPVMMCVIARKAEHVAEMVSPIQSDYRDNFWQGQDVSRERGLPAGDSQIAKVIGEMRRNLASVLAMPEAISPALVYGFENSLHYSLIDPAQAQDAEMPKPKFLERLASPPAPPANLREGREVFDNHGVLLPIVPGIFSDNVAQSVRSGVYEAHEAAELDWLIQSGEVILEIGAGCGFISTYCAKNKHTKAVHCVEANPTLIDVIRLTHRINGVEVTVHHEILGKQDGEADFYVHEDFWASGTHSFLGKPTRVPATNFQRRLDEVRPTMLIVDIEGGEETLFEDVSLAGINKIMVELHQPTIGRRGIKRVFDLLSAQGFHYDVWHSNRSVVTFSHIDRT